MEVGSPSSPANNNVPDYALSSDIKAWYKTGTCGCFRWRATRCNFKRGSARRSLRLEDQAQAHAGDDGAGRHKAPDRTDRNRRRLSRRGAQRRQAGPRVAWQDADRMYPAISPNSSTASTADTISPPCTVVSDGLHCFTG